jgi:hypothetical protein
MSILRKVFNIFLLLSAGLLLSTQGWGNSSNADRWSAAKANAWYAEQPWPVGFNYTPRTAINQLEMWQEDSFDPAVIDQELGWAADIGFNMARVFLHDLLWQQDAQGFIQRIETFLTIADKHDIAIMFVLFDDVWNPQPLLGEQPQPSPQVHNSGWVQSPGAQVLGDLARHDALEPYVRGIIARFGQDDRVAIWDLYNEPGNDNALSYGGDEIDDKHHYSLPLLEKVFRWARMESPQQPLTAAPWRLFNGNWKPDEKGPQGLALFDFMLAHSDIITFHSYGDLQDTLNGLVTLPDDRPMLCTEYMARGHGSTFETLMPFFAQEKIGALHWGFVSGKSQTIYPWKSWIGILRWWDGLFHDEPEPWHHDLLRPDGTAYRQSEVDFIRHVIAGRNAATTE